MLQCVTMKLAVILSVLWLTQADTDYDRQPFGRQMCERLCENIRGCRVYMFTMVDFSCHVTNINVHNVSEENRKFLHMMPKLEKEYPFCQKCKKQSRIFMGKGGTVVYDEGRKGCAEGFTWIQGANVCFGAGLFTYYEAEQKCKETRVPGRLAVVDIVEEFERLRSFLRKQADMRCCWVGAERRNGSFEHWHDGTKIKTELWGKHEPNSGEETCGNLLDKYDFKLNDDSCNVFQCSYVCDFFL